MTGGIINGLGVGSGIDTRAVIDELVAAQRTALTTPINDRLTVLGGRRDALGQLRQALVAISDSLAARVRSGAFGLQPRASSDAVRVERLGAGPAAPVNAELVVERLAGGQRLVAAALPGLDAPVGEGTLSFVFGRRTALEGGDFSFAAGGGGRDFSVTIGPGANSLAGLRDAINAASGGAVRASIVDSGEGFSLVLRGEDGADAAFVVSAAESADAPGLARFRHVAGEQALTLSSAAADARMVFEGVTVTRPGNVVEGLIPGLRVTLERETGAQPLRLGALLDRPALAATLEDFAETLAAMRGLVGDFRRAASGDEAAGVLAADPTARSIDQALVAMINAPVAAAGGLRLRDLGIEVTREGSIRFDAGRFALASNDEAGRAEALLAALSGNGFGQGLAALRNIAGLAAPATEGLTRQSRAANEALARAEARVEAYRAQLTRQFAAMEALVASSKAVGAQISQLVDGWRAMRDR